MRTILLSAISLLVAFVMPLGAIAGTMSGLKEPVQNVREKLIVLLITTDKEKQTKLIADIKRLSEEIDTILKASLETKDISKDTRKKLIAFQEIWVAFRTTRDTEIIPDILSGDEQRIKEAKTTARTIQAERFQKMQALLQ